MTSNIRNLLQGRGRNAGSGSVKVCKGGCAITGQAWGLQILKQVNLRALFHDGHQLVKLLVVSLLVQLDVRRRKHGLEVSPFCQRLLVVDVVEQAGVLGAHARLDRFVEVGLEEATAVGDENVVENLWRCHGDLIRPNADDIAVLLMEIVNDTKAVTYGFVLEFVHSSYF
jgi:hypothetical protein